MRLTTLVIEASLLTGVLAVPSSKFDIPSGTLITTPFVAKRDGGLPSCSSTLRNPTPPGTKCGSAGKIDMTKAAQNYISSMTKLATVNACADKCRLTASCGSFSYAAKKCTLYKQNLMQNKFVASKTTTLWYSASCFQCTCAGDNQIKQQDGTCACSAGSINSPGTKTCTACPSGMVPSTDNTSCVCQGNQQPSTDGTSCACPTGSSVKDSSQPYQCTLDCPDSASLSGTTCTCSQAGYVLSSDGQSCVPTCPASATCDLPECPQGSFFNGIDADGSTECKCIFGVFNIAGTACIDACNRDGSGKFTLPDGSCGCYPTYQLNASGVCSCPTGTSVVNGFCACPGDQTYSNTAGQCVCPTTPKPGTCTCGNNAVLSSDALSCDCQDGFVRSSDGYSCECPSGLSQCYNQCADLNNDQFNCGYCNNICPLVPVSAGSAHGVLYNCINGQCVSPF